MKQSLTKLLEENRGQEGGSEQKEIRTESHVAKKVKENVAPV